MIATMKNGAIPYICPNCGGFVEWRSLHHPEGWWAEEFSCDQCGYSVRGQTRDGAEHLWVQLAVKYRLGFPPDEPERLNGFCEELRKSGATDGTGKIKDIDLYKKIEAKWRNEDCIRKAKENANKGW